MRYKILEALKDTNNNYVSFKVQDERGMVADVKATDLGYSVKNGAKLVNATYNIETGKYRLKKDVIRKQLKAEEYEVAFVVDGYVYEENSDIGNVECNGLIANDGVYVLKDGRAYYTVKATSPLEAYYKGVLLVKEDKFGELVTTSCNLEHVSKGDKYWYKEDLRK